MPAAVVSAFSRFAMLCPCRADMATIVADVCEVMWLSRVVVSFIWVLG